MITAMIIITASNSGSSNDYSYSEPAADPAPVQEPTASDNTTVNQGTEGCLDGAAVREYKDKSLYYDEKKGLSVNTEI